MICYQSLEGLVSALANGFLVRIGGRFAAKLLAAPKRRARERTPFPPNQWQRSKELFQNPNEAGRIVYPPTAPHPEIQGEPRRQGEQHARPRLVVQRSQAVVAGDVTQLPLGTAPVQVWRMGDFGVRHVHHVVSRVEQPETIFLLLAVEIE